MTGKTHLMAGVAVGAAFCSITAGAGWAGSLGDVIACLGCAAVGSLVPDIDEPNSMISNAPRYMLSSYRRRSWFAMLVWVVVSFPLRILSFVIKALFGHRGITHWLITSLVVSLFVEVVAVILGVPIAGLAFLLGYISHIVLDLPSAPNGIAIWKPFSDKQCRMPENAIIRTGGIVDQSLRLVFGLLALVFLF